MAEDKEAIKSVVLTQVLRLNATVHGVVFGIVLGLIIFLATNWLVIKGGQVIGPNLSLLNQFFIGYSVTFFGSIVGFLYGFLTGFLVGFFIATLYNWIVELRSPRTVKR
jgi:hypothetical protein